VTTNGTNENRHVLSAKTNSCDFGNNTRNREGESMRLATKQGQYGTLYRFLFEYADVPGPDSEIVGWWGTWAYNEEHAWENWHDGNEDLGFHATGNVRRAKEVTQ